MDDLWNKATDTSYIKFGERIKKIAFKAPNGYYTKEQVYRRANHLRQKLQQSHPNTYEISVAVYDENISTWRSGKQTGTDDPNIYIYTPEEYDKEHNPNMSKYPDGQIPDLKASKFDVFIMRYK